MCDIPAFNFVMMFERCDIFPLLCPEVFEELRGNILSLVEGQVISEPVVGLRCLGSRLFEFGRVLVLAVTLFGRSGISFPTREVC